jgi:hypothetical protein
MNVEAGFFEDEGTGSITLKRPMSLGVQRILRLCGSLWD